MYPPSGLRDGYDFAAQTAGTFPVIILSNTFSNSDDITTKPYKKNLV